LAFSVNTPQFLSEKAWNLQKGILTKRVKLEHISFASAF